MKAQAWVLDAGAYVISVGRSSADIVWQEELLLTAAECQAEGMDCRADEDTLVDEHTCLGDMVRNERIRLILQEELRGHPRSEAFLQLSLAENPLKASMGGLMSCNNLKRTDASLRDEDIHRILDRINKES